MEDHPAFSLKLRCPVDYNKLWFDEDSGEFYCPGCSYSTKAEDEDAD